MLSYQQWGCADRMPRDDVRESGVAVTGSQYIDHIRRHLRCAYLMSDEKVASLLPGFMEALRCHLVQLQKSMDSGDLEMLGHSGHTLKGALLNLGLVDLASVALEIEELCRQRCQEADYETMVATLQKEIGSFARQRCRS